MNTRIAVNLRARSSVENVAIIGWQVVTCCRFSIKNNQKEIRSVKCCTKLGTWTWLASASHPPSDTTSSYPRRTQYLQQSGRVLNCTEKLKNTKRLTYFTDNALVALIIRQIIFYNTLTMWCHPAPFFDQDGIVHTRFRPKQHLIVDYV